MPPAMPEVEGTTIAFGKKGYTLDLSLVFTVANGLAKGGVGGVSKCQLSSSGTLIIIE